VLPINTVAPPHGLRSACTCTSHSFQKLFFCAQEAISIFLCPSPTPLRSTFRNATRLKRLSRALLAVKRSMVYATYSAADSFSGVQCCNTQSGSFAGDGQPFFKSDDTSCVLIVLAAAHQNYRQGLHFDLRLLSATQRPAPRSLPTLLAHPSSSLSLRSHTHNIFVT